VIERCENVRIARAGGSIDGVWAGDVSCRSPRVVVATGAFAASGGLLPEGVRIPVRPVKGQALALRARDGHPPISRIVWTEQVHLAPKRDGRLIVGATMEEAGFDAAVTAGGVLALLDGVRRAMPCVEEMEVEAVWTGFRPTSDDDAPILGDVDGSGLAIAAGHHRNGILLAPATAQALADLIIKGAMNANASALTFDRFTRKG
jgi:glycine oxidase